jgi:23S rRNA (cytidine1920-2'-O)/16S rRNA (cytidine1409-2'-O)-methyltransferase
MEKKFVGRGGIKLDFALEHFGVDVKDKACLDVGAAVGGFTDCLLQYGAKRVYAVDVGYGQLDWKLRNDPRVAVMERVNILHLQKLPEKVDIVTIDAGWTKLSLVLPVVSKLMVDNGIIIALLKPQYEAEKRFLRKGIVVLEKLKEVVKSVRKEISDLGLIVSEAVPSPILGGGGNTEFLIEIQLKTQNLRLKTKDGKLRS